MSDVWNLDEMTSGKCLQCYGNENLSTRPLPIQVRENDYMLYIVIIISTKRLRLRVT